MKNYIKIFLLGVFAVAACSKVQTPEIPVASIVMSEEEVTLTKGKTFALSVTMLPEDATDKTIVWKSTKESVATVTPEGLVTAVGFGTSYIIATNPASSLTAACMVTVEMRGPYQIIVSEVDGAEISQTVFGYPGMELALKATSTDRDEHIYDWTSYVEDYISVQEGLLTWKSTFASEAPAGYLLYAESQIEVKTEDGTSTSFNAVNNVLSSFGLNEVSRAAGTEVRFDPSESRTVQIYSKTNYGTTLLPTTMYSLKSNNSVVTVAKSSDVWSINASATNGQAEVMLTISGRDVLLAIIRVAEHVVEPDKEFGSGNTEKFPVDDDIDWVVEPEENLNKNN